MPRPPMRAYVASPRAPPVVRCCFADPRSLCPGHRPCLAAARGHASGRVGARRPGPCVLSPCRETVFRENRLPPADAAFHPPTGHFCPETVPQPESLIVSGYSSSSSWEVIHGTASILFLVACPRRGRHAWLWSFFGVEMVTGQPEVSQAPEAGKPLHLLAA